MEEPYKAHGYQEEKIQAVINEPTRAYIIADQVGAGKTLVASEIALRAGWERALFIGIGDTFGQWKSSIERQSRGARTMRNMDNKGKVGKQAFADFLAGEDGFFFATMHFLYAQDWEHFDKLDIEGNPIEKIDKKTGLPTGKFERSKKHLQTYLKMSKRKGGGLDAVVYDEAHLSSAHDSDTRRTLVTFRAQDGEQPWKIALSATWSGNSFENAWSLPRWCWPDLVPAFWNWRSEWCATEDQYVPGKSKPVSKVVGERVPGAWVASLPGYTRWENPDVAPEPVVVRIPPTPEQAAQYKDLERDLMTWALSEAAQGREPLVIDAPGGLYARLKQLALAELSTDSDGNVVLAPSAASAKLNVLRGVLDLWPGQPVVLFTDSKLMVDLTVARMRAAGCSVIGWTGETSKQERARIKEAFIAGEYQYLVATVQSAGTGIDGWQKVCSKVVWLNVPDGDPKLQTQALGRVFRQGRTMQYGEFMHVQLVMTDSQDEKVAENLVAKAIAIQSAIGAHNLVDAA